MSSNANFATRNSLSAGDTVHAQLSVAIKLHCSTARQ